MLTPRQLEVLRQMADAYNRDDFENAEIMAQGILVYLGLENISRKTLNAFIDHTLVSKSDYGGGRHSGLEYWEINSTGLLVARKPEMAEEIWLRLHCGGKPFTFKDDKIVDLE